MSGHGRPVGHASLAQEMNPALSLADRDASGGELYNTTTTEV